MAKPQKSTAQSEVPGLVKKGPLYYLKRDWQLYALMLLPMVFIIVFKYFAYTGLSVAFLDYKIGKGYAGSKFVGLKIFEKVFKHRDFTKAVVNTLLLNVLDLIFSFPMPIILALLLNEIRVKWFKRTTQTLLYLPHFLSWVVIGAVAYQMFATQSGVVNIIAAVMNSYLNVLRGAGDVNVSLVAGLFEMGARLAFASLLAPHLGVWGIWLATPLSWASGCIIPVVRYYSKEWMKRTLI